MNFNRSIANLSQSWMKTNLSYYRSISIYLLITGILFLYSCQTKTKDETEVAADSVAITNPNQEELNSDQSVLLKEILGTSEGGVIRGIPFGTHLSQLKKMETYQMFEEMPTHVGFTHETDQLETIDVLYVLSAEKLVKQIKVDIYLNSEAATKELWNSANATFTQRYGKPEIQPKLITWKKDSLIIDMEDKSEGKDFGLNFRFTPTNFKSMK